jgi:hydrogenase maturation protease
MLTPIVLIGIGNAYRSDDGVGLAAIKALKARGLPNILITECSGDGTELIEIWETARKVILIDAVSSGAKPGTIYRFDALTQPFPTHFSFQSTHAFGVAEAIELARALDQLPPLLIVYAIEGKNFTTGVGLSPEVENALRKAVEQVEHEVLEHSSEKC